MYVVFFFSGPAPSLFSKPIDGCEISTHERSELGVRQIIAEDDFCRVTGWQLTGEPRSPLVSLGREPGQTIEIPAWIADTASSVELALAGSGDEAGENFGPLVVIEAWETYGLAGFPARWLRARVGAGPRDHEVVIFAGRRRQFQQHSCGWHMPIEGAREAIVLTTEPDRAVDLGHEVPSAMPVRNVALPRPDGWMSAADEPKPEGLCAVRGCDLLASGVPDSDGDICGEHRTREHALGREPIAE